MSTARVFWRMKIKTTARATVPAIRAVRIPLIRVCTRPRCEACAAGGVAAEPLTDGDGTVLVAGCGAVISLASLVAGPDRCELAGSLRIRVRRCLHLQFRPLDSQYIRKI